MWGASGSDQGAPGALLLRHTPAVTLSKSPPRSKPQPRSLSHGEMASQRPPSISRAQSPRSAPARGLDKWDVLAAGGPRGAQPVREGPGDARILWPHSVTLGSEYEDAGAYGTDYSQTKETPAGGGGPGMLPTWGTARAEKSRMWRADSRRSWGESPVGTCTATPHSASLNIVAVFSLLTTWGQ